MYDIKQCSYGSSTTAQLSTLVYPPRRWHAAEFPPTFSFLFRMSEASPPLLILNPLHNFITSNVLQVASVGRDRQHGLRSRQGGESCRRSCA